jgi:hypothetical protein
MRTDVFDIILLLFYSLRIMTLQSSDILVQTRLPRPVAKWLKERAQREGESIAASLRRLAVTEATRALVSAWVCHETDCDPSATFARGTLPHYQLRFLTDVGGRGVRFRLTMPSGAPVTRDVWRATGYFRKLDDHRFVLAGDHRPWMVMVSWENTLVNCMEITLRPEERRVVTALRIKGEPKGSGVVAIVYSDGVVAQLRVGRQHGAYHYPLPGESPPQRPGWPAIAPELIITAMEAGSPS